MHENTFKDICIFILMTENNSLRKCSRCKSTKLHTYFSKNRKGDYFKCCDNCRRNKKHKQITPSDLIPSLEFIDRARTEYIEAMIKQSDDKLIYLGELDPNEVNFPDSKFKKMPGTEKIVEYHAFRNININKTMMCRWRLHFDDNITYPRLLLSSATGDFPPKNIAF